MLTLRFPFPSMNTLSPYTSQSKRNESNIRYSPVNVSPKFYKVRATASNVVVGGGDGQERVALPEGLKPELMPKHVAIIMDGNRRWAKGKGLPVEMGHRAGGKALKGLARLCNNWGVKVLSGFAFSTENWIRPKEEVDFLMSLFEEVIQSDLEEFMRYEIKASVIGNKSGLPNSLQKLITQADKRGKSNTGLHLTMAMNYSGRYDILQASRSIARKVKDGLIRVEDIDEILFEQELETKFTEYPNPDLLIRTSGEHRISNFMLWQLGYTELYFTDKMFPDFGEADFIEALRSFQRRERRYGRRKY